MVFEIAVVSAAALAASCLTFFSGFGLGTLLMPVLLLFFPPDAAVAMTAVVHLLNNLLKAALLWRHAVWNVVLRFGLPAMVAAFFGARVLYLLEDVPPLHQYVLAGRTLNITALKLTLGVLIGIFAILEILPALGRLRIAARWLPLGGCLSGFFGGLSGHQGAFRSAFLLKCGLSKEQFIASGVLIACLVDFSRLSVYGGRLAVSTLGNIWPLMIAATLAAFLGVFCGARLLHKVTLKTVQGIVSGLLGFIAVLLVTGWI